MIRILIVDDSALMRSMIKDIVTSTNEFEVIAMAKNGKEAIEYNRSLRPDIITMDIEMPIIDGIEATRVIMEEAPTKIVILSAFASDDAMPTLRALKNGAIEFIQKPSGVISTNLKTIKADLINKLKAISYVSIEKVRQINDQKIRKIEIEKQGVEGKCIVMASSTGGPKVLEILIPSIPADFRGYFFLVQHMPQTFTKTFAERLNKMSDVLVKEVEENEELKPNTVYLAKGDKHFKIKPIKGQLFSKLEKTPPLWGVRPSGDILFDSAAQIFKENTLGIVLTGMGRDATHGSGVIKGLGGKVIVQSSESAFIWGMPGAVVNAGFADYQGDLQGIMDYIKKFMSETDG